MAPVAPTWTPPNAVSEDLAGIAHAKRDGALSPNDANSTSVPRLSESLPRSSWPNLHLHRPPKVRPKGVFTKRNRVAAQSKSFRISEDTRNPSWRRRYSREVWVNAVQMLAILLRNASACVAFVWFATFIFSHGNVLSSQSPLTQSDFEFLAGTSVATHCLFYWMFVGAHVPSLIPLEFTRLREQNRPTTFLFCVQRLVRHTLTIYLLSLVLLTGFLSLVRLSSQRFRVLHPEFYASIVCMHLYAASIRVALRKIFREETVIGQSGQQLSSFQKSNSGWKSIQYFWKAWARDLPILGFIMLAAIYVQFASQYQVNGTRDFLGYTLGSLALKAAIKEAVMLWTHRRKIRDPRTIFLVIGLPTVLIDTQMRIVLQRAQNSQYALTWIFGMAVLEIVMRVSKVFWVKRRLRRWDTRASSNVVIDIAATARSKSSNSHAAAVVKRFGSLQDDTRAIQMKIQLVAFQIAESYANMSAEYIAIGCSSSILFFYWDHPKYNLRSYSSPTLVPDPSTQSPSWFQGSSLPLQLAIEVLVDYISSVVEIGEGIDFPEIRRYHVYLGLLFSCIACANIHICSIVYMTVH